VVAVVVAVVAVLLVPAQVPQLALELPLLWL
jgi:hypothetical protein